MRLLILLFGLIVVTSQVLIAQPQRLEHLKKATKHFKAQEYSKAIKEYQVLLNSPSGKRLMGVDAKLNLAESYFFTNQLEAAKEVYIQVISEADTRVESYLNYGVTLMKLGFYADATHYFGLYSKERKEDPRGQALIDKCKELEAIQPIFSDVTLINQKEINDTLDQFAPTWYGVSNDNRNWRSWKWY